MEISWTSLEIESLVARHRWPPRGLTAFRKATGQALLPCQLPFCWSGLNSPAGSKNNLSHCRMEGLVSSQHSEARPSRVTHRRYHLLPHETLKDLPHTLHSIHMSTPPKIPRLVHRARPRPAHRQRELERRPHSLCAAGGEGIGGQVVLGLEVVPGALGIG